MTNQKIEYDSLEIFAMSLFSAYIQINDKTEMSGTDANTAPQKENFLEISEIAQMRIAEIIILIIWNSIFVLIPTNIGY